MDIALVTTLAVTVLCFTGIWLINVMTKDAGVIDYYWGPGFAVIAVINMYFNGSGTVFEYVLLGCVVLWAARLAIYLVNRHRSSTTEDGRYREMRESGGQSFWWSSLFKVFLLQAVLLWMIAAPLHVAFGASGPAIAMLFWLGIAVFFIGFAIEALADHQLASGKKAANHQTTQASMFSGGLWGKSRHPNYAGEMILWWGLGVAAFGISGSLLALAGPGLLTLVMIGVSIPLTEQHMVRTRPSYENYQDKVPMLIRLGTKRRNQRQAAE